MRRLLVVGAGGHGRVVADAAMTMEKWEDICFVDDRPDVANVLGLRLAGSFGDLARLVRSFPAAVVSVGDAELRLQLLDRCKSLGFELPVVVHRSASVSSFALIGAGCVVFAQCVISAGAVLGRGCIINNGATVDHDCELSDGVHVCPGAHLAGSVRVGSRSWIGIGSCVKQGVCIGSDVVIGAGAAVVSDIDGGAIATGVPARVRRS